MTLAVASERNIFSKNHDCNSYNIVFRVAVNTYAPIFRGVDARGGRKLLYEQTHTQHTRDSHSDDNNKDYSKRCSSIGIIQRTVYTYAKPLNMKHMR